MDSMDRYLFDLLVKNNLKIVNILYFKVINNLGVLSATVLVVMF